MNRRSSYLSSLLVLSALVAVAWQPLRATAEDAPQPRFKHTRVYVGPSTRSTAPTAPRAGGLVFVPTFDSSITNDKNATAIMATINAALTELASNYSDSVTVAVTFKNVKSGLGASQTAYTTVSYADFLTALKSHATTADDATALAHVPTQTNNPVNNDPNMSLTLPNARALGFSANADASGDSTISLNISQMNITASDADPNKYSLRETALHELTEVLGSSSNLDGGTTGPVCPIDLFRYDNKGARTYTQDANASAFFCLDGKTMLAQYNQDKSGDFGDFYSVNGNQQPQIQDAFGSPGVSNLKLVAELVELDVVGYTRGGVPASGTNNNGGPTPQAPVIASASACSPNPAYIGGMCSFSVSATDPNNSPVMVSWDFGDGTNGTGATTSHVYATGGTYTATATVLNGTGLSATSSVVVNVSLTMIKARSVKQSFALNFRFPNNDGGQTSGADKFDITLQNDDFTNAADGTDVQFIIGGAIFDTGTLFKNKAVGDFGRFTLNTRTGTLRYQATKAPLQFTLNPFGAVNDDVSTTVNIPVSVSFNNAIYGDTYSFFYTAVSDRMGKGK